MKKLMITAAVSALMFGAAACSNDNDATMDDANYGDETTVAETDMSTDTDDMDMVEVETVYLTSGQLSAGEIVGAEVMGADGEKIATVDDLLMNSDGQVEMVVFRSGDFIDLVGTKGALPYGELNLVMVEDDEPGFTVSMTEEAIQNVAEFDQDGLNDYSLASELIGTTGEFMNSDESARINDIIVSANGEALYAIIGSPTMVGNDHQLDFSNVMLETDDDGDDVDIVFGGSATELEMLPVFKYDRDDD
jgi:sporulation protein YlmC with PRC-barrel domain